MLSKPVTTSQLFEAVSEQLAKPADAWTAMDAVRSGGAQGWAWDGRLAGRRVLLVDDDRLYRDIGRELLNAAGMEVQVAVSGAEALEKVAHSAFDLVLLDTHMPLMDGHHVMQKLRQNPVLGDLPVIGMTAITLEDSDTSWVASGFNDLLKKPVAPDHLYAKLEQWLPASGQAEAARPPGVMPDAAVSPQQEASMQQALVRLHALLSEGDAEALELLSQHSAGFQQLLGSRHTALRLAIEQFEFDKALSVLQQVMH